MRVWQRVKRVWKVAVWPLDFTARWQDRAAAALLLYGGLVVVLGWLGRRVLSGQPVWANVALVAGIVAVAAGSVGLLRAHPKAPTPAPAAPPGRVPHPPFTDIFPWVEHATGQLVLSLFNDGGYRPIPVQCDITTPAGATFSAHPEDVPAPPGIKWTARFPADFPTTGRRPPAGLYSVRWLHLTFDRNTAELREPIELAQRAFVVYGDGHTDPA